MLDAGLADLLELDSGSSESVGIELGSVVPGLVHHWRHFG